MNINNVSGLNSATLQSLRVLGAVPEHLSLKIVCRLLVGAVLEHDNIYIFSGFSNPLVYIPPLAARFANWASGQEDEVINQLSPNHFINFLEQLYLIRCGQY